MFIILDAYPHGHLSISARPNNYPNHTYEFFTKILETITRKTHTEFYHKFHKAAFPFVPLVKAEEVSLLFSPHVMDCCLQALPGRISLYYLRLVLQCPPAPSFHSPAPSYYTWVSTASPLHTLFCVCVKNNHTGESLKV